MGKFFSAIVMGIAALVGSLIPHSAVQHVTQNPSGSQAITPVAQITVSQDQIAAMGSSLNLTALPVGDNKYSLNGPKKGYVYLCRTLQGRGGAQFAGSWIQGSTWNATQKPAVSGHVTWPNATFSNAISGSSRILSGNDLPVGGYTGTFPIQSTDAAYSYDRNPNSISAHSFSLTLPVSPQYSDTANCMGGEVGVMLDGIPLFNGFDAENRDAAAHEIQDTCDGHPQENGEYHYHSLSSCISDIRETTVIGFALDGFPITGPEVSSGKYLRSNDLDECHGITSSIFLDGKTVTMYHYVMTYDFPYSVSCFRGKPVSLQVISSGQSGGNQSGLPGGSNQPKYGTGSRSSQNSTQQMPQPPQAAFTACSGKISGSSCSFTSPNGTISGNCQTPPGQTSVVCVPNNGGMPPRQ